MREPTKEEKDGIEEYVKSISDDTGIDFYEELDFVQQHKKIPVTLEITNRDMWRNR